MKCMKIMYKVADGIVRAFFLDQTVTRAVIGWDSDCEIQIPNQIFSQHHAILTWEDNHVFVMFPPGVKPINGLKVDGLSLGDGKLEILSGSELSVGNHVFAKTCPPGDVVDLPSEDSSSVIHELKNSLAEQCQMIYGPPDWIANSPSENQIPASENQCIDTNQNRTTHTNSNGMKLVWSESGLEASVILNADNPSVMIGRDMACGIQTSNPSVSRIHAMVTWKDGKLFVQDPPPGRHPTNGTIVDGIKLYRGETLELLPGSELVCGNFAIHVEKVCDNVADKNQLPIFHNNMTMTTYGPPPSFPNSPWKGVGLNVMPPGQCAPPPLQPGNTQPPDDDTNQSK